MTNRFGTACVAVLLLVGCCALSAKADLITSVHVGVGRGVVDEEPIGINAYLGTGSISLAGFSSSADLFEALTIAPSTDEQRFQIFSDADDADWSSFLADITDGTDGGLRTVVGLIGRGEGETYDFESAFFEGFSPDLHGITVAGIELVVDPFEIVSSTIGSETRWRAQGLGGGASHLRFDIHSIPHMPVPGAAALALLGLPAVAVIKRRFD